MIYSARVGAVFGSLLLTGAALAVLLPSAAPPAAAPPPGTVGPDLIVGNIDSALTWGELDGVHAFALGTTPCNVGDEEAEWIASTNRHPVIATNMYRLNGDRFEQIGMSWLKHEFAALQTNYCGNCTPSGGADMLGVGCSSPTSASVPQSPDMLGPRSEVNAYTGVFPFPFGGPPAENFVSKRLQVRTTKLEQGFGPSLEFYVEAIYLSRDDSVAGNGLNNASYRKVDRTGAQPPYGLSFAGATVQQLPAIYAWQDEMPDVTIVPIDVPGEGRLYLGYRAEDLSHGIVQFDYALYNATSDRAVRAFGVETDLVLGQSALSQNIPDHHSGEPYSTLSWRTGRKAGFQYWAARKSFAQDPNSNALRWGTMATFGMVTGGQIAPARVGIQLFKPGGPQRIFVDAVGPAPF